MFSVRLVTVDSYQAHPLPQLDPTFSEFRGSEIKHVPVVRIFGITPTGEKTCLHVHGVFPYLFVPYTGEEDAGILAYRLAASLDAAINVSLGSATSNTQHVYSIQRVSGTPLYGYHRKEHQFLKIYFYNPAMIKRAADLLQNGSVLNQSLQPHESHINYILQFMMDYNIYGMDLINLRCVKHRRLTQTLADLASSGQSVNSENSDIIYLPAKIERQSTCEIEIDAVASDITNRLEIEKNLELNPGLAAIWEEERARRAQAELEGGDSQLVNPKSPPRPTFNPTDNDIYQEQRLARRLLTISQCDESTLLTLPNRSIAYAAEVEDGENLLNSSHVGNISVQTIDKIPLAREESLGSFLGSPVVAASQNTQDSSILGTDDMPLVDLLVQLAHESDEILESVDTDSILGSQTSVLLNDEKSDNEDEDVADLNLTCLQLDSLGSLEIDARPVEQAVEPNNLPNDKDHASMVNVSPFLSPWEVSSCSSKSANDDDRDEDSSKRKDSRDCRLPQYDGAGDVSPTFLNSDNEDVQENSTSAKDFVHLPEYNGTCEIILESRKLDNREKIMKITSRMSNSSLMSNITSEKMIERTVKNKNFQNSHDECLSHEATPLAITNDNYVVNDATVGCSHFDRLLEIGADFVPDLEVMHTSMEIGILMSSKDSDKAESIDDNHDNEIPIEAVLNGDPCFTESAELDKSDLTELHDQYVSLFGNVPLPDVHKSPRIESDLPGNSSGNFVENDFSTKTREITENCHLSRELIVRPDSSSSSENVEPNIQEPEIRGATKNKLNNVIELQNCKELGRTTNDNSDHNCNVVVATWAELQNLQIVEKSKIDAHPSRTRNERGKFPAAPRSMKRRGIRLTSNEKVPSQVLRNSLETNSFKPSNSCPSSPSKIVQNSGKSPIKRLSSLIVGDKSISAMRTMSSDSIAKDEEVRLSSGPLANISRLLQSSFDDENEREFTPLRTAASLDAFHRSIIGSENPLVKNTLSGDKYSSYSVNENENVIALDDCDETFENCGKNCEITLENFLDNVDESLKDSLANPEETFKPEEKNTQGITHYSSQRSHNGSAIDIKEHRHCFLSRFNKILQSDVFTSDQVWIIQKRKRGNPTLEINGPTLCTSRKCKLPVVLLRKIEPKNYEQIVDCPKNNEELSNEDLPGKMCEEKSETAENSSSRLSQSSMENDELPEESKFPMERKSRSRRRCIEPSFENVYDKNDSPINDYVSQPNDPVSGDGTKKEERWAKRFLRNDDDNSRDRYNTRKHSSIVEYMKKRRRCAKKLNVAEESTISRKKPRARTKYKEDNLPGIPGIVNLDLSKKRRRTKNFVFSHYNRNTSDSTSEELRKPRRIQPSKLFPNWGAKCEIPKSPIYDIKDKSPSNGLVIENHDNIAISPERSKSTKPRLAISPIPKRKISPCSKMKNSPPKYRIFSSTPEKRVETIRKDASNILARQKSLSESVALTLMMRESKSCGTRAKLRLILEQRLSEKLNNSEKTQTKLSESSEKTTENKIEIPEVTENQNQVEPTILMISEETIDLKTDDEIKSVEMKPIENIEQDDELSFQTVTDVSETISEKNCEQAISLEPTTEICDPREFDDSTLSAEFRSSVDDETADMFDADRAENSVIAETTSVEELLNEPKQLVYDTDRYENAIKEANFFAGKNYTIDAVSLEIPTCLFEEDSNSVDKRMPKKASENNLGNFQNSCNTTEDSLSEMSIDPRDLDVYDVESLTPSSSLSALDESIDTNESCFEGSESDDHTISESSTNAVCTKKSLEQIPTSVVDGDEIGPEHESSFEEASPAFEALSPSPQICSLLGKSLEEEFTVHSRVEKSENSIDCKKSSESLSNTQNEISLNTIENTSITIDKRSITSGENLLIASHENLWIASSVKPSIAINNPFNKIQVEKKMNFEEDNTKLDSEIENLVSQVVTEFENELDLTDVTENDEESISIIDIEIQLDSVESGNRRILSTFEDKEHSVDATIENDVFKTIEQEEKVSANIEKESEMQSSVQEGTPTFIEEKSKLKNCSKIQKKPLESTQTELESSMIVEKDENRPQSHEKVSELQIFSEEEKEPSKSIQMEMESSTIIEEGENCPESNAKVLKLQIPCKEEKEPSESTHTEMEASRIVEMDVKLPESSEKVLELQILSKKEREILESTQIEIKSSMIVDKNEKLPKNYEKISGLQVFSEQEKETWESTQMEIESSMIVEQNEILPEMYEKERTLPTTAVDKKSHSNIESGNKHLYVSQLSKPIVCTAEKGVQTPLERREKPLADTKIPRELTAVRSESFQETATNPIAPSPTIEKDEVPSKTISNYGKDPTIPIKEIEVSAMEIEVKQDEPKAELQCKSTESRESELRKPKTESKVENEETEINREIESAITSKDEKVPENAENVPLDINKNDVSISGSETKHCKSNEAITSKDTKSVIINENRSSKTPRKRVECRPVSIQLINIDLSKIRNFVPKKRIVSTIQSKALSQTSEQDNKTELLVKDIANIEETSEKPSSLERSTLEIASSHNSADIVEPLAPTELKSSPQNNIEKTSKKILKLSRMPERRSIRIYLEMTKHELNLSQQESSPEFSAKSEPKRDKSMGKIETKITAKTEPSLNLEVNISQDNITLPEFSEDNAKMKSPQLAQSLTAKSMLGTNLQKIIDGTTNPGLLQNFPGDSLETNISQELVLPERKIVDESAALSSIKPKIRDRWRKRPQTISQKVALSQKIIDKTIAPILRSPKKSGYSRKNSQNEEAPTESKSSKPTSEEDAQIITDETSIEHQSVEFHSKSMNTNIQMKTSMVNSREPYRANGYLCQIFKAPKILEHPQSTLTADEGNEILLKNVRKIMQTRPEGQCNESVSSMDESLSEGVYKEMTSPLHFSLLARRIAEAKSEPNTSVDPQINDEFLPEKASLPKKLSRIIMDKDSSGDNVLRQNIVIDKTETESIVMLQRQSPEVTVCSELELSPDNSSSDNSMEASQGSELLIKEIAEENLERRIRENHKVRGHPQTNHETNKDVASLECDLSSEKIVEASKGLELLSQKITEEAVESKSCIIHKRRGRSGKSPEAIVPALPPECESIRNQTAQSIKEKTSQVSELLPQKTTEINMKPKIPIVPKKKGRPGKSPETKFEHGSQDVDLLLQGIAGDNTESSISVVPKRRGRSARSPEEETPPGILREKYSQGSQLLLREIIDENGESKNSVVPKKRGRSQKISEDNSQKLAQHKEPQPIEEEKPQEPESAEENIEPEISVISKKRGRPRKISEDHSQKLSQEEEAQLIEVNKSQEPDSAEENIEPEFCVVPRRKGRPQKISEDNSQKLSQPKEAQPIEEEKPQEPESAEENIESEIFVVPNRRDCSRQKQETSNDKSSRCELSKNPKESQLLPHKITDENVESKNFSLPRRKGRSRKLSEDNSQKLSQQKEHQPIEQEKPQESELAEENIDSEISVVSKRRGRSRKMSENNSQKVSQKAEAQPIERMKFNGPKLAGGTIKPKHSIVPNRRDRSGQNQGTNDDKSSWKNHSQNSQEREMASRKFFEVTDKSKNSTAFKKKYCPRTFSENNPQELPSAEEAEPIEETKSQNPDSAQENVEPDFSGMCKRKLCAWNSSKDNSRKLSQEEEAQPITEKNLQDPESAEETIKSKISVLPSRQDCSRQSQEANDNKLLRDEHDENSDERKLALHKMTEGSISSQDNFQKLSQEENAQPIGKKKFQEPRSAGKNLIPEIPFVPNGQDRSEQNQEMNDDSSSEDERSQNSKERELVRMKMAKESVKSKNSIVLKKRGRSRENFRDYSQKFSQEEEAQPIEDMKSQDPESYEETIKPLISIIPNRRNHSDQSQGTNDDKASWDEESQNVKQRESARIKISAYNSQKLSQKEETQPIEEKKTEDFESVGENNEPEIYVVPNSQYHSGQKQVTNEDNSLLSEIIGACFRRPQLVLRKVTGGNGALKSFTSSRKRGHSGQVLDTNFQNLFEPEIRTERVSHEIAKTPTQSTSMIERNSADREFLPEEFPVTNIERKILSASMKRVRFRDKFIRKFSEYRQNTELSSNEDFTELEPRGHNELLMVNTGSPKVKNIGIASDDESNDMTKNEDLESTDLDSLSLTHRLVLLERQKQNVLFVKRINGVADGAKSPFHSGDSVSLDFLPLQNSTEKLGYLNCEQNPADLKKLAKSLYSDNSMHMDEKLLITKMRWSDLECLSSRTNMPFSANHRQFPVDHAKSYWGSDPQIVAFVQLQEPKILLKRLSRDLLKSHGITYRPKTKIFVKIFKKSTTHENEDFRLPAYDGAADLSSSDTDDEDPDVTIASDEKRVCVYGSTKKMTVTKCDAIVTPKKRKLNVEDGEASSQSSKRRALPTTSNQQSITPYRSPSRTSMLKSPGRISGNYSPLKIIVTSPKVRRETLEPRVSIQLENSDDDAKASPSSSSGVTTPRRKNSRLHDNMLRGRFSIVKSTNRELGDKHVIATTMGSDGLGELDGIQSRGQTKHRTVETVGSVTDCDESTRIQSSTTSLKDIKDARKKLVFSCKEDKLVEIASNTEASNVPDLPVIQPKESSKLQISSEQSARINDNNESVEFPKTLSNLGTAMFHSEPGPSRIYANVDLENRGPCEITIEEKSDDDDDICNITFTQYVNSQMNKKNLPSLDCNTTSTEENKIITIMPKFQPPSCQRIMDTMETYGIPKFRNQEPFFSDPADVPKQKELAHKMLKVSSRSFKDLPAFVSSVEGVTGLARWRKMMLNEFHPSLAKSKDHIVKLALAGNERVVMTPLVQPPTQKHVRNWLKARKYLEEKKRKVEEKESKGKLNEKQDIEIQGQIVDSDEKNERPSNESNSSAIEPSLDRTVVPKMLEKTSNLTLKMKLAKKELFKRAEDLEKTVTKQDADSIEMNSSVLSVLEKSRLFRDQEVSRHLGISCGQIEFLSDSTRSNVSKENLQNAKALLRYQYLTIMCLEVHVTTRGDLLPDAQHDPIAAMFYSVQSDVPPTSSIKPLEHGIIVLAEEEKSKNKMYYSNSSNVPWTISFANNEEALLNSLVNLITCVDPEILIGWELETLSWGYVFQRASRLGINLSKRISRIPTTQCKWEAQAPDIETLAEIKLPGRIVLDIWRLMRHEAALLSYTFESVIHHVLNERIPCPSFKILTDWWNLEQSRPSRWRVIEHYSIRVLGIFRILDQLDIIGRTSELARLFGIQFYEVFTRGSQFRVESVMLRLAKPLNYIAVSPSPQQRASMRAMEALPLIMEPESMFYTDPLIVLDFQSLYPSIIIAHNYCFSTCLGRIEHIGQPQPFEFGAYTLRVPKATAMKLQGKVNYAPCGVAFVKPEIRLGILPRMLTEILETRFMVKKAMKDHKKDDKTLQRALHSRQMGLKFLANVTYGYTAANFSGRMPCIEVGDSVVSKSKETLERAIKLVEMTPKWGARVVYGDTDSLFILVPGKSKADAFVIGNEIADAVTASNPPPIKLKFEKVMYPAILQTKKRYCGYMYETPEQEKPTYLAKGIETVRRDGCPAVSKILEKTLKILFETKDVTSVKKYVTRQLDKVLRGKVSIQDLTFAKEFRGLKGYRARACVPALELTRRLMKKDPRSVPRNSERVRYVIVAGAPNQALIHCVRTPWELINDPGLRPNAVYYITRVIIPPLNRCLNLMGVDVNAWYREMPHRQILDNPVAQPSDKQKLTIFQYFGTIVCVACGQSSNKGICMECLATPADTLVIIHEKLRWLNRTNNHVNAICQSCVGQADVADCASLDCPILYRRAQARRELTQAIQLREIIESGNNLEF